MKKKIIIGLMTLIGFITIATVKAEASEYYVPRERFAVSYCNINEMSVKTSNNVIAKTKLSPLQYINTESELAYFDGVQTLYNDEIGYTSLEESANTEVSGPFILMNHSIYIDEVSSNEINQVSFEYNNFWYGDYNLTELYEQYYPNVVPPPNPFIYESVYFDVDTQFPNIEYLISYYYLNQNNEEPLQYRTVTGAVIGGYVEIIDILENIPLNCWVERLVINQPLERVENGLAIELTHIYGVNFIDENRTIFNPSAPISNFKYWFDNNYTPYVVQYDFTSWIKTAIGGFVNAEIVPGFSIGGVFTILISVALAIYIIKMFLGG